MPQVDVYTEPPPKPADVPLRIYSNPICPFAQRARLIAAAKGVKTEEINIHLKVKPEWFLTKISSVGKVPVIEHEGRLLRESAIVFDYIDEVFGGASVWPSDPYEKAQAKLLVNDFGGQFISNYYKFYGNNEDDKSKQELATFITRVEELIRKNKDGFLGGETAAGAADYLLWPWFERIGAVLIIKPEVSSVFSKDKYPTLFGWIDRMKQLPAVQASLLTDEAHAAFIRSYKGSGKHDYGAADVTGNGVTIYTKKEE